MGKKKKYIKVSTAIKSGGLTYQHNRRVFKVNSGLKSGGFWPNHNLICLSLVK